MLSKDVLEENTDILPGNVAGSDICRTCWQCQNQKFPQEMLYFETLEDVLGILSSEISPGMPHFGGEAHQTPKITDFGGNPALHSRSREFLCKFKERTNRIISLNRTNSPASVSVCALTGLTGQECLTARAEKKPNKLTFAKLVG